MKTTTLEPFGLLVELPEDTPFDAIDVAEVEGWLGEASSSSRSTRTTWSCCAGSNTCLWPEPSCPRRRDGSARCSLGGSARSTITSSFLRAFEAEGVGRQFQYVRVGNALSMGGFYSTRGELGPGCLFTAVAHDAGYHDYSTASAAAATPRTRRTPGLSARNFPSAEETGPQAAWRLPTSPHRKLRRLSLRAAFAARR